MSKCKLAKTPRVIGKSLSKYDGELFEDQTKYRSAKGALQYVTLTRPYIAFAGMPVYALANHSPLACSKKNLEVPKMD